MAVAECADNRETDLIRSLVVVLTIVLNPYGNRLTGVGLVNRQECGRRHSKQLLLMAARTLSSGSRGDTGRSPGGVTVTYREVQMQRPDRPYEVWKGTFEERGGQLVIRCAVCLKGTIEPVVGLPSRMRHGDQTDYRDPVRFPQWCFEKAGPGAASALSPT
jgi:hypothetical protein